MLRRPFNETHKSFSDIKAVIFCRGSLSTLKFHLGKIRCHEFSEGRRLNLEGIANIKLL